MKIGFFEDVARLEVFGDKPRSRSLLVRYACYCCVAVRLFAHIKITKLRIALFPLRSKLERQFLGFVLRYFFPDPKPADADAAGGCHDREGGDCNPGRDREHADGYNPVAGGPDQKQCPGADHDGCEDLGSVKDI